MRIRHTGVMTGTLTACSAMHVAYTVFPYMAIHIVCVCACVCVCVCVCACACACVCVCVHRIYIICYLVLYIYNITVEYKWFESALYPWAIQGQHTQCIGSSNMFSFTSYHSTYTRRSTAFSNRQ